MVAKDWKSWLLQMNASTACGNSEFNYDQLKDCQYLVKSE